MNNTYTLCQLIHGCAPEIPVFLVEGHRNDNNAKFAFTISMELDGREVEDNILTPNDPAGDYHSEFFDWVWEQPAYKKAVRRFNGYSD